MTLLPWTSLRNLEFADWATGSGIADALDSWFETLASMFHVINPKTPFAFIRMTRTPRKTFAK